jgi:superfamily II DNA helicase RecQ
MSINIENEFKTQLLLQDIVVIRANCTRNNIMYKAIQYNSNQNQINQIQEFVIKSQSNFKLYTDKILIFCTSKIEVDLLALQLNCAKYYFEFSNSEKANILLNFTTMFDYYNSILISTSALKESFNYSSICLVIYKDFAYSFIGFLQSSSRSGRDNNTSQSVFFYNSSELINKNTDSVDKLLIRQYLSELVCRRRVIDLFLNNTITNQCNLQNQTICDLCENRLNISSKQINRINNNIQTT